jgi:CRP-like cAMP-binding protein
MAQSRDRSLAKAEVACILSPAARRRLEEHCTWKIVAPGEAVLTFGDDTREVYFITAGKARAVIYSVKGVAVAFRDLQPGALVGEIAAIDGKPRSAGIEAIEQCTVACLPRKLFLDTIRAEPDFALALLERAAGHIRLLTERIYEFSTLGVNHRILAELQRLARETGMAGPAIRISPAPTQTEIAARISTHREAVSRELSRLVKLGIITRTPTSITINDAARLQRMIEDATDN